MDRSGSDLEDHVKRQTYLPIGVGALAAALTIGCSAGTGGELSNGAFTYICTTGTDASCESGLSWPMLLPNAVAVGSQFDLTYSGETPKTEDGIEFQVRIVPASPTMVETLNGTGFRVLLPGDAAFLGRGANGVVADFVHVHVAAIDRIGVDTTGSVVTAVELSESTDVSLTARPIDENGQTLGGGLQYAWSTSDDTVVGVSSSGLDNRATLTGNAAGTATVSVTAGDARADIPVTVGSTQ